MSKRFAWIGVLLTAVACWLAIIGLLFAAGAFGGTCQTHACEKRVAAKKAWNLCVKRQGGNFCTWRNRWRRLPASGQYWTRCVSKAESGNRRYAPESGHHSYFQWVMSTWYATGANRSPYEVTWYEQAVRAWRWHLNNPSGQWPNTGERGRCGS
jgi:hypothetical protein